MKSVCFAVALVSSVVALTCPAAVQKEDYTSPRPPEVDYDAKGVPSDAIRLFDGTNLDAWQNKKGGPAAWPIQADGTMLVDKTGNTPTSVVASVYTKAAFTNFQLHLEFRIPPSVRTMDHPQHRGNSGVGIFGCYEVQVLGSKGQDTYVNGLCGSIYITSAPAVVASRPFGEWENYDIVFHAPRVADGKVLEQATFTVLQNGVLVQDHVHVPPYPDTPGNRLVTSGKIMLQSHNDSSEPVAYRNVWLRPLP